MFYKYSVILDINPMVDKCDEVKDRLDDAFFKYKPVSSSLQEMDTKEQLKFYIDKHMNYSKDRDRMFELIDKL